jgi:hypothetical protein
MFRKNLLATTALLLAASMSGVAAQPAMTASSRMRGNVANRDTNHEFLCTYGQFTVSASRDSISSSNYSAWSNVAIPVYGHGQTVNRITVKEGHSSHSPSSEFTVGIYSNSRSGFPGKLIVRGFGTASRGCLDVFVPITPTTLTNHKKYWIEETAFAHGSSYYDRVFWATKPEKKKAYAQYHIKSYNGNSSYSYTSPWGQLSEGAYVSMRSVPRKRRLIPAR